VVKEGLEGREPLRLESPEAATQKVALRVAGAAETGLVDHPLLEVAREKDHEGFRSIRVGVKELYDEAAVDAEGLHTGQRGADEQMKDALLLDLVVDAEVEAAVGREKGDTRGHRLYEGGLVLLEIDVAGGIRPVVELDLLISLEEGGRPAPTGNASVHWLQGHGRGETEDLIVPLDRVGDGLDEAAWAFGDMGRADLLGLFWNALVEPENVQHLDHLEVGAAQRFYDGDGGMEVCAIMGIYDLIGVYHLLEEFPVTGCLEGLDTLL